jgi:phospholipid/cholesterol/gamma-HCH transport system substrate-binding protein
MERWGGHGRAGVGRGAGHARVRRAVALLLVVLAAAAAAILMFAGDGGYRVTAEFLDGGQLVEGNPVKVGGAPVGSVEGIEVTQDGRAEVTFTIDDEDYAPLRQGTEAVVTQTSLSGIANRFIDLHLGPHGAEEIEDGGRIDADDTRAAVELDQVFDIFDESTRKAVGDFVEGSAKSVEGRGKGLRRGVHYLDPALSTGSRLFQELSRDDALLERFLIDSSELVTALAQRRDDLRGVVSNLGKTFRALGSQQDALAESIALLPPFARRANTTLVNLRDALDDVDPLVNAAKPAVRRLGPFLGQARLFARDGEPTIADLSRTIRGARSNDDLIELIRSFPPLTRAALDPRRINGAERRGAFPETSDALRAVTPTIALGRPYTGDFVGWLDDFSTTGAYDALGGFSRAWLNLSEALYGPGPKVGQFRRCPGANEEAAPDGSNVLSAEEQAALQCDGSQRSVGP